MYPGVQEVLSVVDDGTVYTLMYVPLPGRENGDLALPEQQLSLPLREMWQRIASRMDQRKLGFTDPGHYCDMGSCPERVTLTFHSMELSAQRTTTHVRPCPLELPLPAVLG